MCMVAMLSALGIGGTSAAGVTAAGASAGAALTIGGSLLQGYQAYQTGKQQERALKVQAENTRALNAVQEQRTRAQFRTAMSKQMAELVGRGVSLSSPTAVLLGQTAAQEMAFESQAIRSEGAARATELSSAATIARNRAVSGLLQGTFNAAGPILSAQPELWPELLK